MGSLLETLGAVMSPVMSGQTLLFPMGINEQVQRMAGIKSKDYYFDVDVNTEIALLGAEYYNALPIFIWDAYNFEACGIGQPLIVGDYGLPDIDYNNAIIKTEKDLDKIKWPTDNPLDAGRYPLILKQAELGEKYFGFQMQMWTSLASAFTVACNITSYPVFMAMIKRQPDLAHEILRRIVDDLHTPLFKALSEKWPGISVKFADAWETIPNISPKIQREFAMKYNDRTLENTKDFDMSDIAWFMCYGEGYMPDPLAYLKEKVKYTHAITNTNVEPCPREIYKQAALETGVPLSIQIPSAPIQDGTEASIIEYIRELVKTQRVGVEDFNWLALCPATATSAQIKTVQAAGQAFGVIPCPTIEELDKIDVKVPKIAESFGDFVRRKAKENPEGYTFKWLDKAKFIGE